MHDITPLVSIICTTYNQEQYIAQAIEGFLIQKTSFAFEIIVHDDASTDRTAEIIKKYASRNADLFVTIYQTENQYSKKDINIWTDITFPIARGKYIALCEGDDYWTDTNKLQKQVDLLETDNSIAGSAHGCTISYESGRLARKFIYKNINRIEFPDYLRKNLLLTTGSLIFRLEVLQKVPPFAFELFAGDFVLIYTILSTGAIGYISEDMSVYRKGGNGSWSNREITLKVVKKEFIDNLRVLFYFDEMTNNKFHNEIQWKIKKQFAYYLFHTIPFNSLWMNIKNIFYSFPFLPIRVNGAFIKSIYKTIQWK